MTEIRKAVREADVVVVCLSKQFNQAGYRQKEVRIALDAAMEQPEGEIFIIPARLEECENLESLKKWHWVNLFEADGYHKLIGALKAGAEKICATPAGGGHQNQLQRTRIVKKTERLTESSAHIPSALDVIPDKPSIQITLAQSFPAPGSRAEGITWDGASLWVSDNSGVIFKVDPSGKVMDSLRSPDLTPQGLT